MSGTTWSKWFWSDWQSDSGLRVSSYAARGLWIDCLCIAAENGGYLQVAGKPLSHDDIARVTGGVVFEVVNLLAELERNKVFSRDKRNCIYCRRMLRDEKKARIARENGKMGGNPSLRKQMEIFPSDNPPDTISQIPDTKEKKERKVATRMTRDYPMDEQDMKYAHERNFTHEKLATMFEAFKDHHLSRGNLMADWNAAWRTWVRNEIKFAAERNSGYRGQRSLQDDSKSVSGAATRLQEAIASSSGVVRFPPRPKLDIAASQDDRRLLPKG